jgi:arylsulfatase
LWVAQKYKQPYQGKGPAGFFGMIANLDENMGRLDAFLRSSGLYDNTLVVFMNDNGGTAGVNTFNAGMRDRKTSYYDGGHRAMCFLRWPGGGLRPAGDVDALTQVQDVLPTLIELLSLRAPKQAKFDGASLAALLGGKTDKLADRILIVQYGQTPAKYEAAVMWNKWRLVKGTELYDLTTDPAQQRNIAAEHAGVMRKLRAHYDGWWAEVGPNVAEFVPIVIGAPRENPVTLTAVDWADVYCDNVVNCLLPGQERNGPWTIEVARAGRYEFALRRWPKEADAALTAGLPASKLTDGEYPAGKAMPIAKARLKIGDYDQTLPVKPDDKAVTFTLPLKATAKTRMQTWFYDARGKELSGAYFVYARRL